MNIRPWTIYIKNYIRKFHIGHDTGISYHFRESTAIKPCFLSESKTLVVRQETVACLQERKQPDPKMSVFPPIPDVSTAALHASLMFVKTRCKALLTTSHRHSFHALGLPLQRVAIYAAQYNLPLLLLLSAPFTPFSPSPRE